MAKKNANHLLNKKNHDCGGTQGGEEGAGDSVKTKMKKIRNLNWFYTFLIRTALKQQKVMEGEKLQRRGAGQKVSYRCTGRALGDGAYHRIP